MMMMMMTMWCFCEARELIKDLIGLGSSVELHSWFFLCTLAVLSTQDPGLVQDRFPRISIPSSYPPASNTNYLQIIFVIGQPSLSWLSKTPFSFWDIRRHFIVALFPRVLSIAVRQLLIGADSSQDRFPFTGPNIFLSIFILPIAQVFSSLFITFRTAEPYIAADLMQNSGCYTKQPCNCKAANHEYAVLCIRIWTINPLNTKRRLLYLKTQFVPRRKHFSSLL